MRFITFRVPSLRYVPFIRVEIEVSHTLGGVGGGRVRGPERETERVYMIL